MLYIELSSVITYWSFRVPQCPLNGHDHGQRNQVHDNIKVSYNCQVGTWTGTMIAGACHSPIHGQLVRKRRSRSCGWESRAEEYTLNSHRLQKTAREMSSLDEVVR